ncbi:MAG: iron-regulated protein [Myxococcales bacterium]|nr:iron-regulated protein [Myxococcales bacterium]
MHLMLRRLLPLPLLFACTTSTPPGWGDPAFEEEAHEAVEGYVHLVIKSYAATVEAAEALDVAVDAFLAAPSDATLEAARQAWLTARDIYGQTEVYRFYGGPIDAEPDGLEGRINSWPMDEAYVDYVDGMPNVGVINNPTDYPDITRELLIDLNGAGGEDDISTGWHAIEFLLWGQDLRDDGAGQRPFTDYVDGEGGTAANQRRRADYLAIVTDLLVEDLKAVAAAWDEGAAYHEEFEHDLGPHKALENVLLGMGSLAGAELSGERMGVAYDTREQEDEHSCFSDNTHNDLRTNALGLQNAYLSRWGGAEETSVSTLVAALDPALDQAMRERLQAAVDAIDAIPPPFDSAIKAPDGSPERQSVADAIAALKELTATIVEVATLLDISLNLEE